MKKDIVGFVIVILIYSLASFAYMHKTFPSKDVLDMVIKQLDRIELKLEEIHNR